MNFRRVMCESDCLVLVEALKKKRYDFHEYERSVRFAASFFFATGTFVSSMCYVKLMRMRVASRGLELICGVW